MDNWFTVKKISSDTFAISENKHWEETNCYLLCGTERAALIDTGLGVSNIKAVVDSLTGLPVTVLTTHAHWDHIGGHKYFSRFEVHEAEKDWLTGKFPLPLQLVKKNLELKPCDFPEGFNIADYRIFEGVPDAVFTDGDCFSLGNRELTVIHTPGLSPGHCCFYERERGWLYSGDLIYSGCLYAFYPTTDPELFFKSVRRVQSMDISRVLPAHHRTDIPVGIIGRIGEAFELLESQGRLQQGQGVFSFEGFQIHI